MAIPGGGGPGKSRPVVRRKPAPKPAAAIPGLGAVARPSRPARAPRPTPRQVQRVTAQARPLSPRPVRPKPVPVPGRRAVALVPGLGEARGATKPLQATPPRNIRAGKPVRTARQRRAVAVAAYDELTGAEKHAHVNEAHRRAVAGKATQTDKAILHAHRTRVEGTKKVARAQRAFDVLSPETTARKVAFPGVHTRTLSVEAGSRAAEKLAMEPEPFRKRAGTVANIPSVGKIVRTVAPLAAAGYRKHGLGIVANAAEDVGELATTSPSSVAKFATTAVKHPRRAAEQLAEPYKELAKHPGEFIKKRPVSAALMVAPVARAPGLVAGKVLRTAGKQTLKRPTAALSHTALRQERVGSRAAGRRVLQARTDRKVPTPSVTAREIDRRVDESYAATQQHSERVRGAILHEAQQDAKTLTKHLPRKERKAQRKTVMEQAGEHAGQAVMAQKRRRYAEEFGATPKVENGRVIEQPSAQSAHLHESLADAHAVKEHLNAKGQTITRGPGSVFEGGIGAKLNSKEKLKVEYTVRDAGFGKYAVMPKQVADRLNLHGRIGKEKAVPAVVLRQSRRMLTRAVLPTRPTWLTGQSIEGGIRSAIRGAGPTSWMRAHRLQARHPDIYKALAERAVPGGQIGRVAAHEMATRTLQQEIPDSLVARRITEWGQKPGVAQLRNLHNAYVRFVFDRVNGQVLEGIPQKTILGRVLKQHPLMDRKLLGLSNKAIDEAARGIRNPETMAGLGREVARSYGKYAGFSPRMRSLIMHWTPFIPWWINSAKFVLQTLPRDHPIATGLIADISTAEEDWRKQAGLSLRYRDENSLPPWMLGGLPIQGGRNLARLGHYVPGGSETDPVGALVGQVLPQFSGAYGALRYGKDWKGDDLKHSDGTPYNEGERILYSTAQLIESMVPFTAQGAQVARLPEVLGGPPESDTKTLKQRATKQVLPVSVVPLRREQQDKGGAQVTRVKVKPVKVRRVKVKPVQTGG